MMSNPPSMSNQIADSLPALLIKSGAEELSQ